MLLADLPGMSLNGGSNYELASKKRKKERQRGGEDRRKRRKGRKIRVKCKREGWKGGRKEGGKRGRKEGEGKKEKKRTNGVGLDREGRRRADRKRFCFYVSPTTKGSSCLGPVRIFKLSPNGAHTPGQRPTDPGGLLPWVVSDV